MKTLDIGQVARWSGLPASTLRYYEEKGLIRSIGRSGLKRVFAETVLQRLALIALGRTAGFALEDIGAMLSAEGGPAIDRQQLSSKADQLDQTIKRLSAIRDGLRHAAACPADNHLHCATFQRLMAAAAKQMAKTKPAPTPPDKG
ncbi:MAG: helix-turn-helix domain-containing protein [Gammaproteobacteria bacterium]|nr:helix-turn-helix domain-containing protein [Gammaproteobacteria bacterium]MBU1488494.1 helix-turn-helix domain-containing protein [Gammaproteobacteria bacterium]MBU2067085.1 helix-turn-helix domain-containing protein [Gammaproteobacteria bacterium]MBU2138082.1 helix-turn-helix domain-containing protein [Gammaproteobacteria bacterium]MBU2216059.1 helix-turn-helix domain-containing protein [Gammaproteobacteria bacterium]